MKTEEHSQPNLKYSGGIMELCGLEGGQMASASQARVRSDEGPSENLEADDELQMKMRRLGEHL